MTKTAPTNHDDIIDSRDIIERIETLEDERDNMPKGWAASDDEVKELQVLQALAKEGSDYAPDWEYGEALVRDSHFVEYAQELLTDCGCLPEDIPHYVHIDWEGTARDVRMDYTAIDFDGITYWIR